MARSRTTSVSSTGGGVALPPPNFVHTPDHGGPGYQPTVSSGAGSYHSFVFQLFFLRHVRFTTVHFIPLSDSQRYTLYLWPIPNGTLYTFVRATMR